MIDVYLIAVPLNISKVRQIRIEYRYKFKVLKRKINKIETYILANFLQFLHEIYIAIYVPTYCMLIPQHNHFDKPMRVKRKQF